MQLSRKNVLVRRSSVCPYVLSVPWSLSRKLRKMDPLLPQNIISKLSPSILLPIHILHRHPPLGRYPGFNFFKCWHINMESCSTCRQTTAIVNRFDRRHTAGVLNCWKQSATVETCCRQSSSLAHVVWRQSRTIGRPVFFRSGSDILEQASSNLFSLILIILKQNPPHSVIVSIWHLLCQIKCIVSNKSKYISVSYVSE